MGRKLRSRSKIRTSLGRMGIRYRRISGFFESVFWLGHRREPVSSAKAGSAHSIGIPDKTFFFGRL
jgi:hypothetical protein